MRDADPDLLSRVRQLEDERLIRDLIVRLATTVDGTDVAPWLECFSAEGTFTWTASGQAAPSLNLRGRDELARWFAQHRSNHPAGTQIHLTLQPRIRVDGGRATADSQYVTLKTDGAEIVVASSGTYRDSFVKDAEGAWRVCRHDSFGVMMRAR